MNTTSGDYNYYSVILLIEAHMEFLIPISGIMLGPRIEMENFFKKSLKTVDIDRNEDVQLRRSDMRSECQSFL